MKPPFDLAADLDTPVSAFLKLAPLKPHFLLESVEGGERQGRYSFIGFGDARRFSLDGHFLVVDGEPRPISDPLAALRLALSLAPRPMPDLPGLKLTGGLVGAIGYDFVRRLERLPGRAAERPDAAFVAPKSLLVFDHATRRIALLHDGTDADRTALMREVVAVLRGGIPTRLGPGVSRAARVAPPRPSLTAPEFHAAVGRAREHIAMGDVFQLVLSIRFGGECEIAPFQVYRALRLLNPSPYLFYLDLGDRQVIGSSPEALVKLEHDVATLRPIAGTRPRGLDEADDRRLETELLADAKEAAEHVMLVDLARNDLGRVAATGTIEVAPFRTVERYSHVMHLVSGVRGRLAPGKDAFDLFGASFPAGTVTGAPKVRAMELIDAIEPVGRGFYSGTVGYFGHGGAMDQALAIRTLELKDGRYAYQAGAGIVADSIAENEHAEVQAKGAALGAALALAEEGL